MDDEKILSMGGTEDDIRLYAEEHGADLTEKDFMPTQDKKPEWKKTETELYDKFADSDFPGMIDETTRMETLVLYVKSQISQAEQRGHNSAIDQAVKVVDKMKYQTKTLEPDYIHTFQGMVKYPGSRTIEETNKRVKINKILSKAITNLTTLKTDRSEE